MQQFQRSGGGEGGRGTAAVQPLHGLVPPALLSKVDPCPLEGLDDQPYRVHYRSLDIAGWVLLGSCISLVIILAGTTWHYRWLDVELCQYLGAHQLFILDWKSAFQAKGKTSEGGTVGKKAFVQEEHLEEEEVWQGGGGYWI